MERKCKQLPVSKGQFFISLWKLLIISIKGAPDLCRHSYSGHISSHPLLFPHSRTPKTSLLNTDMYVTISFTVNSESNARRIAHVEQCFGTSGQVNSPWKRLAYILFYYTSHKINNCYIQCRCVKMERTTHAAEATVP